MPPTVEPRRVLFLCAGNTCRSAMAEALAEARHPGSGISYGSAGLLAQDGNPAQPASIGALGEWGIDASSHRATVFDPAAGWDRIYVMTASQRDEVLQMVPRADVRLLRLDGEDIADPWGSDLDTYRATRDEIAAALDERFSVRLRPVEESDLGVFYRHQQDPDAIWMAAFTPEDPSDELAFRAHWAHLVAGPSISVRTVLAADEVAGYVASWVEGDATEITYWIGREWWGRGVATAALGTFVESAEARPLRARAAADNLASIRVLEKSGFRQAGTEHGFANARGSEIEEAVFLLED